jgi:hypothetical protein
VPLAGAEQFNSLLTQSLGDLRSSDLRLSIVEFDFFRLFTRVQEAPNAFGFSNFAGAACQGCRLGSNEPSGIAANPDEYFFWDDIHPSAAAHQVIGDAAFALLIGDYNQSGIIDAADYVVWRKGLGTTYTQMDYDTWRANFGKTAGSGAALPSAEPLSATIPEVSTAVLFALGTIAATTFLRTRRNCWTSQFQNGRLMN